MFASWVIRSSLLKLKKVHYIKRILKYNKKKKTENKFTKKVYSRTRLSLFLAKIHFNCYLKKRIFLEDVSLYSSKTYAFIILVERIIYNTVYGFVDKYVYIRIACWNSHFRFYRLQCPAISGRSCSLRCCEFS